MPQKNVNFKLKRNIRIKVSVNLLLFFQKKEKRKINLKIFNENLFFKNNSLKGGEKEIQMNFLIESLLRKNLGCKHS